MKKQLLSLAMLASIFVVGNVFAGSEEEKKASTSGKEKIVNVDENTAGGSDSQSYAPKKHICTRCFKEPFMKHWKKLAIGGGISAAVVAAKLVYDYVNKSADEDEDLEDEEL